MKILEMDETSFKEIFGLYFDPVCRFLNLYTKDEAVIEDVVQEVFYKLWENRKFVQVKHIKSYLYTSARNRMLNHIRDEKLHVQHLSTYMEEETNLLYADECFDMEEYSKIISQAIEDLPAKCQHVFKLSRFGKMTYKEIALQEGISEKMVEKHISTALRKIKEKVRKQPFILF